MNPPSDIRYFEPLLFYLDDAGAHLKSVRASALIEDICQRVSQVPDLKMVDPSRQAPRDPITEAYELIEAMQAVPPGLFDDRLMEDILLYNISQ